jgi:putative addiction module component (TIGR02574 family)
MQLHRMPGAPCLAPETWVSLRATLLLLSYLMFSILDPMELLTHDEVVRLTPPERLALISQLGDSLEDDQLPLTAAKRTELNGRLATLDQDRREGMSWSALKAELEQRRS